MPLAQRARSLIETILTHLAARDLEAAGFDRTQAEALAAAIRNSQGDLATKSDIDMLKWAVGINVAITVATFAVVAAKLL